MPIHSAFRCLEKGLLQTIMELLMKQEKLSTYFSRCERSINKSMQKRIRLVWTIMFCLSFLSSGKNSDWISSVLDQLRRTKRKKPPQAPRNQQVHLIATNLTRHTAVAIIVLGHTILAIILTTVTISNMIVLIAMNAMNATIFLATINLQAQPPWQSQ